MFNKLFKSADPDSLTDNFFKEIHKDWMLITAGDSDHFNTMTASWGTMGILWNKRIAICFIRPTRFTYQFAEKSPFFTLSFFDSEYQDALSFCGCNSGRNVDKIAATGLKPVETPDGNITFMQSRLVFECRKLYADMIRNENFIDTGLVNLHYPRKDYHKFYIGEIEKCYKRISDNSLPA